LTTAPALEQTGRLELGPPAAFRLRVLRVAPDAECASLSKGRVCFFFIDSDNFFFRKKPGVYATDSINFNKKKEEKERKRREENKKGSRFSKEMKFHFSKFVRPGRLALRAR
jgi:hypothetical protein